MNKILKTVLLSFGILAILVTPVLAVADGQVRTTVTNNIAARCDIITNKIDLIITKYDVNKEKHITRYQNIYNSVNELSVKLEKNGYDVTELNTDLKTLDQYIKEFSTEYTAFVDQLRASQQYACANSEGEFAKSVASARSYLLQARETTLSIRILVNDEIRADLQAIKNQK